MSKGHFKRRMGLKKKRLAPRKATPQLEVETPEVVEEEKKVKKAKKTKKAKAVKKEKSDKSRKKAE